MSTNDVPGAKASNNDILAMGCWAEHDDGSLILVEAVEAGKVVYSIFDVKKYVEYRDTMPESLFKKQFSWDPLIKTVPALNLKWTWHDKTPFPWGDILADFPTGQKDVSAGVTMSAAQRVADSLNLRADKVRERQVVHPTAQRPARTIMNRIKAAVDALVE